MSKTTLIQPAIFAPDDQGTQIPRLEDWESLSVAGARIGFSGRQGIHHAVFKACEFDFTNDVRVVLSATGEPTFLLRTTAVDTFIAARAAEPGQYRSPVAGDPELVALQATMRALMREAKLRPEARLRFVNDVLINVSGRTVDSYWHFMTKDEFEAIIDRLRARIARRVVTNE